MCNGESIKIIAFYFVIIYTPCYHSYFASKQCANVTMKSAYARLLKQVP